MQKIAHSMLKSATTHSATVNRFFDKPWVRSLLLLIAAGLALAVTLYPRGLMQDGVALNHGLLSLLMWGMSAGFVHGVGFTPSNPWLRVLFGPTIAWPLLLLGWVLFIHGYLY
jgi:cyd operon protein YbgE